MKSLHAEKAAVEQSREVLEGGKKEAEEKVKDLEKRIKVCLPAFDECSPVLHVAVPQGFAQIFGLPAGPGNCAWSL